MPFYRADEIWHCARARRLQAISDFAKIHWLRSDLANLQAITHNDILYNFVPRYGLNRFATADSHRYAASFPHLFNRELNTWGFLSVAVSKYPPAVRKVANSFSLLGVFH